MPPRFVPLSSLCLFALLASTAGCAGPCSTCGPCGNSPYGYAPAGAYSGSTYGSPGNLGVPIDSMGPATLQPGAPYPQPAGGDAPAYDPGTDGGNFEAPYGSPVPDPRNLEAGPGPSHRSPTDDLRSPFSGANLEFVPESRDMEVIVPASAEFPENAPIASRATEEDFFPPIEMRPGSPRASQIPATAVSETVATNAKDLNPFGYDSHRYEWLRGQVDFDPRSNTWHIIYAERPAPADQYGGAMLLTALPADADLQDGAIVFVQGAVDSATPAPNGKPSYRVRTIRRLRPRR